MKTISSLVIYLLIISCLSPILADSKFGLAFYVPQLVLSGFNKIWYNEGYGDNLYTTGWFNWGLNGFYSTDHHLLKWDIAIPGINFLALEDSSSQDKQPDVDKYFWDISGSYSYAPILEESFTLLTGVKYKYNNFNSIIHSDPIETWAQEYNYLGGTLGVSFFNSIEEGTSCWHLNQEVGYMWGGGGLSFTSSITFGATSYFDTVSSGFFGETTVEYTYNQAFNYVRFYLVLGFLLN